MLVGYRRDLTELGSAFIVAAQCRSLRVTVEVVNQKFNPKEPSAGDFLGLHAVRSKLDVLRGKVLGPGARVMAHFGCFRPHHDVPWGIAS